MAYDVREIAKKILSKACPDCGDEISNLKLQKLLYYMQGFHLACFGTPLFEDDFYAWQHGPVIPSVYDIYKSNGSNGIPYPNGDILRLTPEEEDLFDQVYNAYGQFSAFKLRDMTHEETPWKSTALNNIISKDKLTTFFKTRIED